MWPEPSWGAAALLRRAEPGHGDAAGAPPIPARRGTSAGRYRVIEPGACYCFGPLNERALNPMAYRRVLLKLSANR